MLSNKAFQHIFCVKQSLELFDDSVQLVHSLAEICREVSCLEHDRCDVGVGVPDE
jgi:hypothetical protein